MYRIYLFSTHACMPCCSLIFFHGQFKRYLREQMKHTFIEQIFINMSIKDEATMLKCIHSSAIRIQK